MYNILEGDLLSQLLNLPDQSFDAVICDPPYHLTQNSRGGSSRKCSNQPGDGGTTPFGRHRVGTDKSSTDKGFMGQTWDGGDIAFQPDTWKSVMRVMKPGAYLMAFGGTRTFHRMAVAMEDAGFIWVDTLMWFYGCLDEKTECLTKRGWLKYDQLTKEDDVLQWNHETNQLTWTHPEAIYVYPYFGDMVILKNRHTEQVLTPNHRVYAKIKRHSRNKKEKSFSVLSALEIHQRTTGWQIDLPLAGNLEDGIHIDPQYAYMVGWWLTDAWLHGDKKACMFSQSKPKTIEKLKAALDGHNYSEYIRNGKKSSHQDEHTFYVTGPLADRLISEYPNREMSWDFLSWDKNARLALLNGLLDGDGSRAETSEKGVVRKIEIFWSKKKIRRDIFMSLAISLGMRAMEGEKGCVYIHPDRNTSQIQSKHQPQLSNYSGNVWCIKVPNGAFVVRRSGKPFITGNSGFPKSHNIAASIDKTLGGSGERTGAPNKNTYDGASRNPSAHGNPADQSNIGDWGLKQSPHGLPTIALEHEIAQQWEGYGTALKPAYEPILLCRKPFEKRHNTYAKNILKWGCGALNIDGCRIPIQPDDDPRLGGNGSWKTDKMAKTVYEGGYAGNVVHSSELGRWPANILLDEDAAKILDAQSGIRKSGKMASGIKRFKRKGNVFGELPLTLTREYSSSQGGASRSFMCPRCPPKKEMQAWMD